MKCFIVTCLKTYFILMLFAGVVLLTKGCNGLNLSLKDLDLQTTTEHLQNPNQPVIPRVDEKR